MTRRLAMFFVMLSVFWQALAVAGQMPVFASHEALEHAAMHLQEEGHHHNDDGAVELDESSDSKLHMMANGMPSAAVEAFTLSVPAPDWGSSPPSAALDSILPHPILEGLRRPPRHTA
jgi:hypothetical protein